MRLKVWQALVLIVPTAFIVTMLLRFPYSTLACMAVGGFLGYLTRPRGIE